MAKSAKLHARIEPEVKEQAESILSALGIPVSSAVNIFYKQIILQRGLPFDVKLPPIGITDASVLSEGELNSELQKGFDDVVSGKTKPAAEVFSDLRKEYGV